MQIQWLAYTISYILAMDKKSTYRNRIFSILLLIAASMLFADCAWARKVSIVKEKDAWQLFVNNEPFYIKGVGCGYHKGRQGQDYLKLAKELGANCVRTWGTDQGTREYLDTAHAYGLMVDAGIWLNWADPDKGFSYRGDTQYKKDKRREVLNYVKEFKDHPALLMWNVGNEALFFTESHEEKIALCQFLNKLIKEIHAIDPDHPVIYTSAAFLHFSYLKKYVPDLDIVGTNAYCSLRIIQSNWQHHEFSKPYVVTEFAHYLPNDRPKDANGVAIELGDYQKASVYRELLAQLEEFKGYNLGGFVFHLGETTQESMTWWNINQGSLKRQTYWEVFKQYTGKLPSRAAPRIEKMSLSKVKDIACNESIDIEVTVRFDQDEDYLYEYKVSTATHDVLKYYVNEFVDVSVEGSGKKVIIKAPSQEGVYRVYCFVKDRFGNVSSVNKSISVKNIHTLKN